MPMRPPDHATSTALAATSPSGAGGNRTPVHQAQTARATTIPDVGPDGGPRAGPSTLGRHRRVFPRCQRSFPPPAVLSGCHPPLLLPGCGGAAPCGLAAHDFTHVTWRSGSESEFLLFGSFFVAPFYESEQLGSHARPPKLMSNPISPVDVANRQHTGRRATYSMPLRWRPSDRAASILASRSAMAWRKSPFLRPRARPSSTLARPSRK